MDDGCENTGISIYFQCRILAAKTNENFKSRFAVHYRWKKSFD